MGYLDQLKNISNVPDDEPKETKELPNPNCLGFLGSSYGVLEKSDALESSARWLLHFSDREPLAVAVSPVATHPEVLEAYRDALAAEPIEPGRRQPDTLLAGDREAAVLAWLAQIDETDQAIVAEVLALCRHDDDARAYFLGRANEVHPDTDDRRHCAQCSSLRGGVCIVAKPGSLVSALRGYRPATPELLQRCAGYSPRTK
ncbi:MAG: hypothetical protein NFW04_15605 [Candidatus Accumulibacter sp.]|uniref:hypothetical protein n=1 Tax=Accumulibacter sp. TaxID=2053492 RepID=UPI0025E46504|nr:hypothetical protein [Accumulibacter sp.]MCM8600057.1 hypothetical protein [Accumulibacter sp.]